MELHPNIKYRSDIDGLRALAVLSVILFHINPNWIPGGFLGVDIFFVISGYLITLILTKEIDETNKISISNFYKRRIKRIIPALLFVLIPTIITGFILFTMNDFLSLFTSSVWGFFSAANIYFFSFIDTGYFSTGSNELPLLHLWSLGVEEQFYILWPFIVLYLLRHVVSIKKRIFLIVSIIAISLILAQFIIVSNHSFAYYMLPTRAWELLSGATIALLVHNEFKTKNIINEIMAAVGFFIIILSFIFISESDPVPGIAAIPTILGTSLLILSGISYHTYIGRLLSFKFFVGIGLVSYSAYLWHWPILAFLRYSMVDIDLGISIMVIALTFILASISYFFIEAPLRKNNVATNKVFKYYFIIPAIILLISSILFTKALKHSPSLFYSEKDLDKQFLILPNHKYAYSCLWTKFDTNTYNEDRCVYPKHKKPTVFLIGDSNANHYIGMIRVFSDYYGFVTRNAAQSACPFVLNEKEYSWIRPKYAEGCLTYRRTVLDEAIKYDTVIVGGSWDSYDNTEFKKDFLTTIDLLSKKVKKIIILAKIPIMDNYSKDCAQKSIKMPWIECKNKFTNTGAEVSINRYIKEITEKYSNVYYFDIRNQTCKNNECSPYVDNKPVYYDYGHLSMSGSKLIGEIMLKNNDPMLKVFEGLK